MCKVLDEKLDNKQKLKVYSKAWKYYKKDHPNISYRDYQKRVWSKDSKVNICVCKYIEKALS